MADVNELSIQTLMFDFAETTCDITFKTAAGQETIACGYGTWQHSQTTLFHEPLLFDHAKIATSGAWTSEDTFTILCRLYETPFYYRMVCHFADDELLLEIQVNVSLESTKPLFVTAKRV